MSVQPDIDRFYGIFHLCQWLLNLPEFGQVWEQVLIALETIYQRCYHICLFDLLHKAKICPVLPNTDTKTVVHTFIKC